MVTALLFAAAAASVASPARAERPYLSARIPAPADAFEISAGTAYTQGFGMLQAGVAMPDVATAGIGVDIGIAHRAAPQWAWGVRGQFQELAAVRGTGARGVTVGIDLAYHTRPTRRIDPWLQVGSGYRRLWETSSTSPTLVTHGLELAHVLIGVDLRTGDNIAFGPALGGDLDLFLWQNQGAGNVPIAGPRLSGFVYLGIQGRFDLGGARYFVPGGPILFGAR